MAKNKKTYKSFKLYTNQSIQAVVIFSILAGVLGALFGIIFNQPVSQVLGVNTFGY